MSNISELANVPEISFIENMTIEETEELLIADYRRLYKDFYEVEPTLADGDPIRLLIKASALVIYQVMQYVDTKGRAELLKTSTGSALEALAALFGLGRQPPTRATATERFTLAATRSDVVAVPAGTRVKTEKGRYFNTVEYAQIPAGQTYVDVTVQAEEPGEKSSGIPAGEIALLVDPIPYIASVTNTTESTGGLDAESDDSLTERIYIAPSRYSSAGPRDAYEFYARTWRSDVADVQILSEEPCEINIYFTLENEGTGLPRLPTATERANLAAYLSGETMRPMCDLVSCYAPEEVSYTISLTYWIASSDQASAGTIQDRVATAVSAFQAWQRKMGRDVNPTELIYRIREAGAKRVTLTAPTDITVTAVQLPKCTDVTINYGGLEDD